MSETSEAVEQDSKATKILGVIRRLGVRAAKFLLLPALAAWAGYTIYQDPARAGTYIAGHLGIVFWAVIVMAIIMGRVAEARARMKVIVAPGKSRRTKIKDPLQPTPTAVGEWIELAFLRDKIPWRIVQVVITAWTVWTVSTRPLAMDAFLTPPINWSQVSVILLAPILWVGMLALRIRPTMKKRHETIKAIYNIARSSMKFPRLTARPTGEQVRLQDPFRVIKIREWETLELPRRFRVEGPSDMSVTNTTAWDEVMENLDAKMPHPEGWHLDKDRSGTSADVYPAQYPSSVLWNGEIDPDPLVFLAGADLDNPGEMTSFTFGETSPHIMATGGTGSGKSSFAEIVLAQAGIKPMPWDPSLYADCQIIDPKGPFANRWENRPNMTVTNGAVDLPDEMGDVQSGVVAMAMHAERLLAELERRSQVQQGFKGIATWIDLPDDVKKAEKLRPVIIVMDEFLDHVTKDSSKSEQAEVENAARDRIVYITGQIARKGRSLGMHLILIAQDGKMTDIGSSLVRQMVARIVLGNMDRNAMARMFGEGTELGILPTSRLVNGRLKGIPGRGRLMNAPGQAIRRVQVAWFGGSSNLDALDKFLPRAVPNDEVRESIDGMTDMDGNGIPDAWEQDRPATLRIISEADFDALTAAPVAEETEEVAEAEAEPVDEDLPHAAADEDAPTITLEKTDTAPEPRDPWGASAPAEPAEPEAPATPAATAEPDWMTNNPFAKKPAPEPAEPAAEVKLRDEEDEPTPAPTAPAAGGFDVTDLFGSGKPRP